MLTGMDIPATAGPWLVLGLVLGILLPALATLGVLALRRPRSRSRPDAAPAVPPPAGFGPPADLGEDDLPAFLESPPGSAPPPAAPSGGWAPLGGPATPGPGTALPAAARRDRSGTTPVLAAMAGIALLLIGAAAAVATARASHPGSGGEQRATDAPPPAEVSARLTFGGIVLERHAVGVTVAYPRVLVTSRTDRSTAEVELGTFNCLRAQAPEDPAAAGCTRAATEYAELSTPELRVVPDGAALRISGRFATVLRPNGSPSVPTGRAYDLTVTSAPADGRPGEGPEPATGLLLVGDDRVGTGDDGTSEIAYGG
jgi:hypothetical protein